MCLSRASYIMSLCVHFGLLLRMVTQLSIFRRSAGVKVGSIDAAALSVAA